MGNERRKEDGSLGRIMTEQELEEPHLDGEPWQFGVLIGMSIGGVVWILIAGEPPGTESTRLLWSLGLLAGTYTGFVFGYIATQLILKYRQGEP